MTGGFSNTGTEPEAAPPDVDLDRVWIGVAAQVWRRRPGPLEQLAGRLLRSPGLARALVTTPSLLAGWVIASAVVLAAGAAATLSTGTPYVALLAPAVAGPASPTPTGRASTRPGNCRRAWRSATGWCCWSGRWPCSR